MSAAAPMEFLHESGGRKWYFAKPGLFTRPGLWFWDGEKNVHIDDALAETQRSSSGARSDKPEIEGGVSRTEPALTDEQQVQGFEVWIERTERGWSYDLMAAFKAGIALIATKGQP